MGIRIRKGWYTMLSFDGSGIDPKYMGWKKEKLLSYIEEHPFPNDPAYSQDDMIYDLSQSEGLLTFVDDIKEETIDYMRDLMNELS